VPYGYLLMLALRLTGLGGLQSGAALKLTSNLSAVVPDYVLSVGITFRRSDQ
jgi:hypothetical protein